MPTIRYLTRPIPPPLPPPLPSNNQSFPATLLYVYQQLTLETEKLRNVCRTEG